MTKEKLEVDVLGGYDDDLEIQCIDENGNAYDIVGIHTSNDVNSRTLSLRIKNVKSYECIDCKRYTRAAMDGDFCEKTGSYKEAQDPPCEDFDKK